MGKKQKKVLTTDDIKDVGGWNEVNAALRVQANHGGQC